MVIFSLGGVESVFAEEPPPIRYDEYLDVLRQKHGVNFETPRARFEVVIKDSAGNIKERIFVDENPQAAYSMIRGQTMHDIAMSTSPCLQGEVDKIILYYSVSMI
jgi:hypothetical protein